jgi:hypothetical protein
MRSGFEAQARRLWPDYSEIHLMHMGKLDEAMARFYRLTFSSTIVKEYFEGLNGTREIKDIHSYNSSKAKDHCDEINRMAIVFLHSMIEEIMRSFVFHTAAADPRILVQWFLSQQSISVSMLETALLTSNTDEEIMNGIAMTKLSAKNEAALVQKISTKLHATLQRTSIQGTSDINKMLSICKYTIDDYHLRKMEPVIAQVCSRRNLIVHNMDESDGEALSVKTETIDEWADLVRDYLMVVICSARKIDKLI